MANEKRLSVSDKELLKMREILKQEKGVQKNNCTKEEIVNAANLLLSHTGEITNLMDTVVGMKLFLERLGLENECFIAIYPGDYRPRFHVDGGNEDG